MVEIYINRRSKRSLPLIWTPEYIRVIAPAFELLYEGRETGTLLPLYNLLRLRGPREFGPLEAPFEARFSCVTRLGIFLINLKNTT